MLKVWCICMHCKIMSTKSSFLILTCSVFKTQTVSEYQSEGRFDSLPHGIMLCLFAKCYFSSFVIHISYSEAYKIPYIFTKGILFLNYFLTCQPPLCATVILWITARCVCNGSHRDGKGMPFRDSWGGKRTVGDWEDALTHGRCSGESLWSYFIANEPFSEEPSLHMNLMMFNLSKYCAIV